MRLRVVSLPATHERDEEHVELVLREPVAVDLGVDERGHDVVAGVGSRRSAAIASQYA